MHYVWLILFDPWFLWIVGIVLAQVVLGPAFCWLTLRRPTEVAFREVLPGDPDFKSDFEAFLRRSTAELLELGFVFLTYATMERGVYARQQSVVTIFRHPKTYAWALCYGVRTAGNPLLRTTVFEFQTEFCDGTEVLTSAIDNVPVFAKRPSVISIRYKQSQTSIRELYDVHRKMVIHFGRSPVDSRALDPLEMLTEGVQKENSYQAQRGLFTLTRGGTQWRMTVWGAVIMTWKLVWPITLIPRMATTWRRHKILRQLKSVTLPLEN